MGPSARDKSSLLCASAVSCRRGRVEVQCVKWEKVQMDISALINQLLSSIGATILFGVWAYMVFRFLATGVV